MKGKIALLAAGGLLLYLANKAKGIKETVRFLEWMPAGVALKFEGLTPVLHIKLDIHNPNKTSVPVTGIIGQLYWKGSKVASFSNQDKLKIDGSETGQATVKLRLSLFNTVVSLFTKDPSPKVEIDGLIKTPFTDIPFGYSYDFTTKKAAKKEQPVAGPYTGRKPAWVKNIWYGDPPFVDAFNPHHIRRNNHLIKRSA